MGYQIHKLFDWKTTEGYEDEVQATNFLTQKTVNYNPMLQTDLFVDFSWLKFNW